MGRRREYWIVLCCIIAGCGGQDAPAPERPPTSVTPLGAGVLEACDVADTLLQRAPGTTRRRVDPIPFDSAWGEPVGRTACRVAAVGHVPGEYAIIDSLIAWLTERGWDTRTSIAADGPDGTVQGLRRSGVTCVIEGRWDGGDDSDPAYMPSDSIEVRLTCSALAASDTIHPP